MSLRSRSFKPAPFPYEVIEEGSVLPDWKLRAIREEEARQRARDAEIRALAEGCEYKASLKEYFRQNGCVLCGKFRPPCHIHHVRTKGAGGQAKDQVPVCAWCHTAGHTKGFKSLESLFKKDLWQIKDSLAEDAFKLGLLPVEICSKCGSWHSVKFIIDQIDTTTGETQRVCTTRCAPEGPI